MNPGQTAEDPDLGPLECEFGSQGSNWIHLPSPSKVYQMTKSSLTFDVVT